MSSGQRGVPISEERAQEIMAKQQQKQEQEAAFTEQKESMLMAFVSAEGRERLKRIEQVRPERARSVEMHIIQQVRAGKMQPPIGDDMIRTLLVQLSEGESTGGGANKITVIRKRTLDDM